MTWAAMQADSAWLQALLWGGLALMGSGLFVLLFPAISIGFRKWRFGEPEIAFLIPGKEVVERLGLSDEFSYASIREQERRIPSLALPLGEWTVMVSWVLWEETTVTDLQWGLEPGDAGVTIEELRRHPYAAKMMRDGYLDWAGRFHTYSSYPMTLPGSYCWLNTVRIRADRPARVHLLIDASIQGRGLVRRRLPVDFMIVKETSLLGKKIGLFLLSWN